MNHRCNSISIVFLFYYLLLFPSALPQEIQLNINSSQFIYKGVIKYAIDYVSSIAIEVHPIALFVNHQSYNSTYRVILAKQINATDIIIQEIKIFTGKNTSGRFDIFYNEILYNLSHLHFIQASYLTIQLAAEKYLKEQGLTLKYLLSLEINEEGVFIIHLVAKDINEYVLVGCKWRFENENKEELDQSHLITGMFKLYKHNSSN